MDKNTSIEMLKNLIQNIHDDNIFIAYASYDQENENDVTMHLRMIGTPSIYDRKRTDFVTPQNTTN